MCRPIRLTAVALSTSLIAACGGSASGPPALLETTAPTLVLAAAGTARLITVTNQGPQAATAFRATATQLPTGTSLRTTCPSELQPGAACLLLITPGATPSAAPGDLAPVPGEVAISADNADPLNVAVSVVGYGSVHEGGYVIGIDDTTPVTGGIGGKTMATAEIASVHWSPVDAVVAGIYPDSTAAQGDCNGATDGRCNTGRILAQFTTSDRSFAAAACADSRQGGVADWYLPAVCELSYDNGSPGTVCGTQAAPLVPDNLRSRLYDVGLAGPYSLIYWSSTHSRRTGLGGVGMVRVGVYGPSFFTGDLDKRGSPAPARCMRTFTP